MLRCSILVIACALVGAAARPATGDPDPDPPPAGEEPEPGELIEVTGEAPVAPGTISLDARVAREAPGALGEPLRALSLLPGVTTSIAASGYPIIRGTLPGESRFSFDGIEVPMLYHLLVGNQVIHPSFIGDLELRAGGHGAESGHLLGGAIAMTPANTDRDRTEIRANLLEVGTYLSRRLSDRTSIAAAARVGTLAGAMKIYDANAALYTVDQQTQLVHRLGNGDRLTLTSLGAFDHLEVPPDPDEETYQFGFHRLDARWTRSRGRWGARAGVQTEFDTVRRVYVPFDPMLPPLPGFPPDPPPPPTFREGGRSYGARAYADGSARVADWLRLRGGVEARYRAIVSRDFPLSFDESADPFLKLARNVDSEGAWAALDLRIGRFTVTPGVRADSYHAEMLDVSPRHGSVDPRLSIAAALPGGARAELSGGTYTAPPQASIMDREILIGPLPMADGAASNAGLSRSVQGQASLQVPLGAGVRGDFAAYYRDTQYSVDFAMVGRSFGDLTNICDPRINSIGAPVYRNIDTRAMGVEAMVRGELSRDVTGWVSYSLGKIDRDFGFVRLPHDYDQRHTLNATGQWRRGKWRFGASAHVRTGRPVIYPQLQECPSFFPGEPPYTTSFEDPTRLRRVPIAWRVDLRAERRFQFSNWTMKGYIEMQNASLTKEVLGYELEVSPSGKPLGIVEETLFLPLPIIGVEVEL